MSYNTYWNGDLSVTPELSSEQRRRLSEWLGMDGYKIRGIDDEKLGARMRDAGFKYDIAWNPVSTIDAETISISAEGHHPYVMAFIIRRIMDKLPNNVLEGEVFWDGDEKEDIGMLKIEDGKLWYCPAAIVYAIPAGNDAELIP